MTEQKATPRNASLVKERVRLLPVKKGRVHMIYLLLFVCSELRIGYLMDASVFVAEVKDSKEKVKAISTKTGGLNF